MQSVQVNEFMLKRQRERENEREQERKRESVCVCVCVRERDLKANYGSCQIHFILNRSQYKVQYVNKIITESNEKMNKCSKKLLSYFAERQSKRAHKLFLNSFKQIDLL